MFLQARVLARNLGFAPGVLGMIWALGGLAALVGAFAAEPLVCRFGIGNTLIGGLFLGGLGSLFVPLAREAGLLAGICLVAVQIVSDPGYTVYDIQQVSLRQAVTAERLQRRVNATLEFAGTGATMLGALLGGILGAKIELRSTLFLVSGLTCLAALLLWLSLMRKVRTPPTAQLE